ncbi:FAD-dependent oxidoreductase [Paenibacillus sp. P26]|nr:FAD-dependent oxidoreductase [Paenibacillus sp. P26]
MTKRTYDVIVVGAGPAGIFTAYELTLKAPGARVLLVDKGHDIDHRSCPILEEKIKLCPPPAGKKHSPAVCRPAPSPAASEAPGPTATANSTLLQNSAAG